MLDDLNIMLSEQLNGCGPLIEAERHILRSNKAKLIRPRFLFACGNLLNIPESKLMKLACAVELIHSASLLHDDIVDQAKTRRSLQSVNSKFGNSTALLAGDQLLARALLLIADTKNPEKLIRAAAKTLLIMSDAASLEISTKNQKSIGYEQILSITDGKTGELFSLCGQLAGFAANDDMAAEKLGSIGKLIGRTFQIKDDIKDINEDKLCNIHTLPITFGVEVALEESNKSYNKALKLTESYDNNKNFPKFSEIIDEIAQNKAVI